MELVIVTAAPRNDQGTVVDELVVIVPRIPCPTDELLLRGMAYCVLVLLSLIRRRPPFGVHKQRSSR